MIRSSCLTALATIMSAMGTELLPVLPALLPAVISAASVAVQRLPHSSILASAATHHQPHSLDSGDVTTASRHSQGDSSEEDEVEVVELATPTAPLEVVLNSATPSSSSQGQPKLAQPAQSAARTATGEAAAALAALQALVETPLAAFLAPQLPALLTLLLQSHLMACQATAVADLCKQIMRQLPEVVPGRLLLPALARQLDAALTVSPARSSSTL